MVGHQPLQSYRRNYVISCVTGCIGCRWHRYQQSKDDTKKKDVIWFIVLLLTYAYTILWLYFWSIARNDYQDFNGYLEEKLQFWYDWHWVMVSVSIAATVYLSLLVIFCIVHTILGYEVYIHSVHKVFVVGILMCCVTATVLITDLWRTQWSIVLRSLVIFAPFLHIVGVFTMTLLSWLFIRGIYSVEKTGVKLAWLSLFLSVMLFLYLCPLTMSSPCIAEAENLPVKPLIFAHRGASKISPENTMMSFATAVKYNAFGIESDVRISVDGIPFIMHDYDGIRTTNIEEIFPELAEFNIAYLNFTQLGQLNAGSWFLQDDPFYTADTLTSEERQTAQEQRIPTLAELVALCHQYNTSLMFDLIQPPDDHPYYNDFINQTLKVILHTDIPEQLVWWLPDDNTKAFVQSKAPHFVYISESKSKVKDLRRLKIFKLNMQSSDISDKEIRHYENNGIDVNMYAVNSPWLFSYYWCVGVESVVTDNCHKFRNLNTPLLAMNSTVFLITWVVVDVVSIIVICIMISVQCYFHARSNLKPESISLKSAGGSSNSSKKRHKSSMRERLLYIVDTERKGNRSRSLFDRDPTSLTIQYQDTLGGSMTNLDDDSFLQALENNDVIVQASNHYITS